MPRRITGHKFEAKWEQCRVIGFEGTWSTGVKARLSLAGATPHGLMVATRYRHWGHNGTHPKICNRDARVSGQRES